MSSLIPVSVDPLSFFLGVFVATILWWIIARLRPLSKEMVDGWRQRREEAGERRLNTLEEDHRRVTVRRAQGMHLAAPLFALDEILVEPRLLAPPPHVEPGGLLASEDAVTLTLPYLPAWPELAAIYNAPTLTLAEALSGGVNLAIIGQPGAGKTVALAHLACLIAERSEALGALRDSVPFLLHVADLTLPLRGAKDLLSRMIEMIGEFASARDLKRVESFVQSAFRSGRALVLLDGFDELTAQGQNDVMDYLRQLLQAYPAVRIVTTGAPEYVDGLLGLDFVPLALAAWSSQSQARFVKQWGELWSTSVAYEVQTENQEHQIEPLLFASWLSDSSQILTPLELTLKVWAASARDWLGPHVLDAIGAHIRRLAPANTPQDALETLAAQVMLTAQPVFELDRARLWVKDFELPEGPEAAQVQLQAKNGELAAEAADLENVKIGSLTTTIPSEDLLGRLATTGLVIAYPGKRMRFVHPVLGGYLAGGALSRFKAEDTLLNQPDWIGKLLTMRYFAAQGEASSLVDAMLGWSRLPMHRPLLTIARWLSDAPREAPWRGKVMAALADLLQTAGLPVSLRAQALGALVASDDPAIATLFRHMATASADETPQLAALGIGAVRDEKAVGTLESMLRSLSPSSRRAACLALVAIGTTGALEFVGQALLSGDEDLRRTAAEALANDPAEGYAMLKDGATMRDIHVRRAAVYGLGRIREPWSTQLLDTTRLEDEQWVIRNVANEVLEAQSSAKDPRIPRPLKPPSETPWLVAFASLQGVGIPAGSEATDLLLSALKSPNPDERLAALDHLRRRPNDGIVKAMYEAMFGTDAELREAAFLCLWEIGASGYKLPDPIQFGIS